MDATGSIPITPRHQVMLDPDYWPMIERAPREDFVVRTLVSRTAGEMPLMSADIVIAGAATRGTYPLAERYPLHFRKTYYPGKLHGHPSVEFERHTLASTVIPIPPPIGFTRTSFRSCLLPGQPLDRLSELGVEPDERNVALARAMPLIALAGLWRIAETAFELLSRLQQAGLTHGDAHLHNFLVCPSPLEVLPVDFERAILRDGVDADTWERRCAEDRRHLLRQAVFLQSALGGQRGPLGEQSLSQLDALVTPAESFRRAITERTFAGALT